MKLRFLTIIVALCAFASFDADAQSMRLAVPVMLIRELTLSAASASHSAM